MSHKEPATSSPSAPKADSPPKKTPRAVVTGVRREPPRQTSIHCFGALLLRIGLGTLIATHGFPLFLNSFETWKEIGSAMSLLGIDFLHLIWGLASVVLQSFGGIALVIGVYTKSTAFLLFFIVSLALAGSIQGNESIERILVFTQIDLALLSLVFIGPGRYSFDRRGI